MTPITYLVLILHLICYLPKITSQSMEVLPDPILAMCDDGLPDVIVTLGNDESILLKQHYYWTFDLLSTNSSANLLSLTSSPILINQTFERAPSHIDMAITSFGANANAMKMTGKTIFVKGDTYYLYDNYKFLISATIDLWLKDPSISDRDYFDKIMYQKNDSISVYKSRPLFEHSESAMLFDDPHRPENIEAIRSFDLFEPNVKHILSASSISSFYLIPTKAESYYLFWQEDNLGRYCYLKTYKSKCHAHDVTSLFNCPTTIAQVRGRHFLGHFMTVQRITTHDFLILMIGWQLATLLILLILIIITFIKYHILRGIKIEVDSMDERMTSRHLTLD